MKIIFHTNFGSITLELDAKKAPKTVENFLEYVNQGFYENTVFHRVIDGFMIQGGGFESNMTQKKPFLDPICNEAKTGLKNEIGTIAMARTSAPHSASSQFFINVKNNPFLDFKNETIEGWGYCAFGRVVEGMDIVQKIAKVPTSRQAGHDDVPVDPVTIERVELVSSCE